MATSSTTQAASTEDLPEPSYLTTKRYINMARQLDGAVEQLHVPDCLKAVSGEDDATTTD